MSTRSNGALPLVLLLAGLLTAQGQTSSSALTASQQSDGTRATPSSPRPKLLIVVAHPDDEYMFAATTYRLARELHWVADQVVITDGESGYRYASLAEAIYGKKLDGESEGHANLPAIRKEELLRAARILGIRKHYFLDQKDLGFGASAAEASAENWDQPKIVKFLSNLLVRERY